MLNHSRPVTAPTGQSHCQQAQRHAGPLSSGGADQIWLRALGSITPLCMLSWQRTQPLKLTLQHWDTDTPYPALHGVLAMHTQMRLQTELQAGVEPRAGFKAEAQNPTILSPVPQSRAWLSVADRWKRLRRAARALAEPERKQGHPLCCIISASRMMRSACFRAARKPCRHSTCGAWPDSHGEAESVEGDVAQHQCR